MYHFLTCSAHADDQLGEHLVKLKTVPQLMNGILGSLFHVRKQQDLHNHTFDYCYFGNRASLQDIIKHQKKIELMMVFHLRIMGDQVENYS